MMRNLIGKKWNSSRSGAVTTTSPSMSAKPRSWLLISHSRRSHLAPLPDYGTNDTETFCQSPLTAEFDSWKINMKAGESKSVEFFGTTWSIPTWTWTVLLLAFPGYAPCMGQYNKRHLGYLSFTLHLFRLTTIIEQIVFFDGMNKYVTLSHAIDGLIYFFRLHY